MAIMVFYISIHVELMIKMKKLVSFRSFGMEERLFHSPNRTSHLLPAVSDITYTATPTLMSVPSAGGSSIH